MNKVELKFIKFAAIMAMEKVRITLKIDESFYNTMAKAANRKGLTVAAFSRYVLKKYFNDHAKKQTDSNP